MPSHFKEKEEKKAPKQLDDFMVNFKEGISDYYYCYSIWNGQSRL